MNSDKQVISPTAYPQQPPYEDDVSFIDIISFLLRRKKLISIIIVSVVCMGLIYVLTSKQVYQVKSLLTPPTFEDVQPLGVFGGGKVDRSDVYQTFISNLESRSLRKEFFDKHKLLLLFSENPNQEVSAYDEIKIFENFTKSVQIIKNKKSKNIQIVLDGIHKEKIGVWLDALVEMANNQTKNQLVSDLQADIDLRIRDLKIQIASKRSIYKQRRNDELVRLQEAYQTAKKLGLRDNSSNNMLSSTKNLSIYMSGNKLYMSGTKILQAEIDSLTNRKSDDVYITGLRDLQEQVSRLTNIKIDRSKLQTVTIDRKASIYAELIKPRKILIMILSIVFGGLLGIFGALIMEFVGKYKDKVVNLPSDPI